MVKAASLVRYSGAAATRHRAARPTHQRPSSEFHRISKKSPASDVLTGPLTWAGYFTPMITPRAAVHPDQRPSLQALR
jgi:hypothetical protein